MARIRTIKPEFWSDEKLSLLSPIDRIVFLGLISMADDYGRVQDNVKIIDAFIFPNTDDSVRESLANLSRMVRIKRGKSSNGMSIIEIVNWDKHQKVDKPQPKTALPPIDENTNENTGENTIREPFANDSRTVRELVAPHTTDPDPDPDLRPPTYDHSCDFLQNHERAKSESEVTEIVSLWNSSRAPAKVQKLTRDRKDKIRRRLRDPTWKQAFIDAIAMLPIPNDARFTWQPDFDWITANDSNALKIVEGKYARKTRSTQEIAF